MKILIPDIGDFANVAVIEVLVNPGDSVAAEDSLLTLESDKATMDVPSPAAGIISAVHIKPGDKVSAGTHIADMQESDSAASESNSESESKSGTESESKSGTESESKSGTESESKSESKSDSESAASESNSQSESNSYPPPQAAGGKNEPQEVRVPDIGDFANVAVIEVLVRPGDSVAAEDSLLTLESDKATMDVPSPFGGEVREVLAAAGDKVSAGDLIARIVPNAESGTKTESAKENATPASPPDSAAKSDSAMQDSRSASSRPPLTPVVESGDGFAKPHAGPSVRRFARELGADLSKIKGSGSRGRILRTDVQTFVKEMLAQKSANGAPLSPPPVDFSKFGEVELHPIPRIRKLSADHLRRNWQIAPHVTQCGEADITDMENFRKSLAEEAKKEGYRMTPLAFFVRAAVMALRQFPEFNASLHQDGEHVVRKKYFHIGVAVDTPQGLVVPVLRNADKKGLTDIARELAEISARAREGKLKADEMQGGCFTISSLGGIGGTFFTPILNLPEAAILGVSRSEMRPHWDGEKFIPRLILPLSLSYDHRLIDGAAGARFMVYCASLLGDIRRLSL